MGFLQRLFGNPSKSKDALMPEANFIAEFDEKEVRCTRPDGKIEKIAWEEINSIFIITTDEGPFVCDWYWIFEGSDSGCAVPQGATGEKELLEKIQSLPNFNNQAILDASPSTDNAKFVCWKKGDT